MLMQPGRAIWMLGRQVALVGMGKNQAHGQCCSRLSGQWGGKSTPGSPRLPFGGSWVPIFCNSNWLRHDEPLTLSTCGGAEGEGGRWIRCYRTSSGRPCQWQREAQTPLEAWDGQTRLTSLPLSCVMNCTLNPAPLIALSVRKAQTPALRAEPNHQGHQYLRGKSSLPTRWVRDV